MVLDAEIGLRRATERVVPTGRALLPDGRISVDGAERG